MKRYSMERRGASYEAFGESKTLAEWVLDNRCRASIIVLISRLHVLGWGVERALTEPIHASEVFAFGKHNSVAGWSRDPRCVVGYHTLYRRIFRLGWLAEDAITLPAYSSRPGKARRRGPSKVKNFATWVDT